MHQCLDIVRITVLQHPMMIILYTTYSSFDRTLMLTGYIFMYVCVCVCMYVRMYVHVCMYVCMYVCIYLFLFLHVCTM